MRRMKVCLAMAAGIILWLLYLTDYEMAKYGIYSFYSYQVHELISAVPVLLSFLTVCALIYIAVITYKNKKYRENIVIILLLAVLSAGQIYYGTLLSNVFGSCIAMVEHIDQQNEEVQIVASGRHMTLHCPKIISNLLEVGDTEYFISYSWQAKHPERGEITSAKLAE